LVGFIIFFQCFEFVISKQFIATEKTERKTKKDQEN
jgi:hypothetical protein